MIALSQCPGIDPPAKDSSAALQAALNLKQPIMFDCPVACAMGSDPAKGIFVPDGSDVTFTPQGRLTVDNVGFPALTFMHASGVWRGTKLRYNGAFGTTATRNSALWNDGPARAYLAARAINTFAVSYGGTFFTGNTNTAALISVRGASTVSFQGGKIYVDDDVPASSFAPVAMAIDPCYAPGLANAAAALVVPNVSVKDFLLDGALMGFVGGGNQVSFENVTRRRYSDLQDAAGGNLGGVGTWFAPPHFFYLQGNPTNPMTATLKNIVDDGQYVGNPIRRLATSGCIPSIKIEIANGTLIDGYYSRCLDGGLWVMSNGSPTGGKVRNAYFLIDTAIKSIDGVAVSQGLCFPSAHPYPASDIEVTVRNLSANKWPFAAPPPVAGMRVRVTVEQ